MWEGAELTVVVSKDLQKRPSVIVHISNTSEITTDMTGLRIQNSELNTTDWSFMKRKVTEMKHTLSPSIVPTLLKP